MGMGWALCAGASWDSCHSEADLVDPLPGSPAAVATLVPGKNVENSESLPGKDMGSNSQTLEASCSITHLPPSLQRANAQIADPVGHQSSDHVKGWPHPSPPFYTLTGSPGRGQAGWCPAPLSMGSQHRSVPRVGLVQASASQESAGLAGNTRQAPGTDRPEVRPCLTISPLLLLSTASAPAPPTDPSKCLFRFVGHLSLPSKKPPQTYLQKACTPIPAGSCTSKLKKIVTRDT